MGTLCLPPSTHTSTTLPIMSRSGALDDNEMQSEMNKMVGIVCASLELGLLSARLLIRRWAPGRVHLAGGEGEGPRDSGQGRRGVCDREGASGWGDCAEIELKRRARDQAKIVQQESTAIDAQFEKKKKQAQTGWKMWVHHPCQIFLFADA